jgi:hypothetical protein
MDKNPGRASAAPGQYLDQLAGRGGVEIADQFQMQVIAVSVDQYFEIGRHGPVLPVKAQHARPPKAEHYF